MRKNRILIVLIWFFLLVLFFLQNSYKPIIVLSFFSIILIIDILLFLFSAKKYQVSTHLKSEFLDNKKISGQLTLKTTNRFLFNQVIVNYMLVNQLTNETIKKQVSFFNLKNNDETLNFQLESEYSGKLRLEVESIRFSDFFHLFEISGIGEISEEELVIYPDSYHFEITPPNFLGDANQTSLVINQNRAKQGDMFDFKTYEVGDPVKNIHWKMSMKEQELIVRELSEEASHKQLILLETNYLTTDSKVSNRSIHALVATFVSTIETMVENNQTITIGWLSQTSQTIQAETISSKENLQLIEKCLADISYQQADGLVWHYFKDYITQVNYSRIIYLHPDLTRGNFNEFPQTFPIAIGENSNALPNTTHIHAEHYEADIANLII